MIKDIGNILLGLLLLPFSIGFLWELGATLTSIAYEPLIPYWFVGGILIYLIVHFLFRQPILAYVVGHELTHALFAVLFGGSVKAFHASEKGGQVQITKSNVIITLAPYFFPLYCFTALAGFWICRAAGWRSFEAWFVLLSGAAFAFHIVLTLIFLQTDQNDIKEHGVFFSYPLILLFNVLLTALIIRLLLARDMSFPGYLQGGIVKGLGIYGSVVRAFAGMIST